MFGKRIINLFFIFEKKINKQIEIKDKIQISIFRNSFSLNVACAYFLVNIVVFLLLSIIGFLMMMAINMTSNNLSGLYVDGN